MEIPSPARGRWLNSSFQPGSKEGGTPLPAAYLDYPTIEIEDYNHRFPRTYSHGLRRLKKPCTSRTSASRNWALSRSKEALSDRRKSPTRTSILHVPCRPSHVSSELTSDQALLVFRTAITTYG
ncbi:hypothetical protein R1flu_009455 [Riccia fluitans]|uniref:Uncharacterized protein n=1 Tax=Riccia fluitans TaxID=41844 RepID=A0ABD1Z2X6_9MARC